MATKVFTSADILPTSIVGQIGVDVVGAAAQITSFSDGATWTQTTNTDVNGFGSVNPSLTIGIIVDGTLIDDASVPPVIVMTDITVSYDYVLDVGAGAPMPGAQAVIVSVGNDPGGVQIGVGNTSGNSSASNDPTTLTGSVTRAALFAFTWEWVNFNSWGNYNGAPIPFVAHARQVTVSNYTITVTYTTPSTVVSVTPSSGSISGGQAVTIRGSGFTGSPGALFGGSAVTAWVVVDDETATAVTPEHLSGLVDVEVLSVATGTGLYTYVVDTINLPPMPSRTPIQQGGGQKGITRRG